MFCRGRISRPFDCQGYLLINHTLQLLCEYTETTWKRLVYQLATFAKRIEYRNKMHTNIQMSLHRMIRILSAFRTIYSKNGGEVDFSPRRWKLGSRCTFIQPLFQEEELVAEDTILYYFTEDLEMWGALRLWYLMIQRYRLLLKHMLRFS
jgi:hypothetical protein